MNVSIRIPLELVEQIAERAAAIVVERQAASVSPWLNTEQAADYIAASVSRVHDLVQLRKLEPRADGRRLVFHRTDLDAYLETRRDDSVTRAAATRSSPQQRTAARLRSARPAA